MNKLNELKKELKDLTQNNTYFIKAFGHSPRWRKELEKINCLECPIKLEAEVNKLRQSKIELENEQKAEKTNKLLEQRVLAQKLESLGLTKRDLELLGLKPQILDEIKEDDPIERLRRLREK